MHWKPNFAPKQSFLSYQANSNLQAFLLAEHIYGKQLFYIFDLRCLLLLHESNTI